MKNSRPTLVLMAGLPGAGKTTLTCALARELGWQVIDKDMYRVELLKQGMDDEQAANRAYERSFNEIRMALVEQQASVIFDTAALHHFILDTVKEIVDCTTGAQLKVILCVVDRDQRNNRLRTRRGQHTDITLDPATIADYLQYFEHLPQDKLTLFTTAPFEECLTTAKEYVIS
jgi:predicted kinase